MWRKVILTLLCAGCVTPYVPGRRVERPGLLVRAQAAITRDDWDDAAVLIARFLRENPTDPWAIQGRYLLGTYYLKEHDLESAEAEFEYVVARAGPTRLGRQARIRIADVAMAGGEYERAAAMYSRLLQDARRHKDAAELSFKLALMRQRQGQWHQADVLFQSVRAKHSGSVFAMRAAEQLAIPHHFSLQVGAYRDRSNAESKRKILAERGHAASVHQLQRHGRPFYCVRVGAFPSRDEAKEFRTTQKGDPDLRLSDVVP